MGLGMVFFGAALLILSLALAITTSDALPLYAQIIQGTVCAIWTAVIFGVVLMQLRRRLNHRTVTVSEGIVTMSSSPIWPGGQTLQLHQNDGMRVAHQQRSACRLAMPWWRGESMREYGIYVSGTRSKSDWDVELVPPFTLSQHEATRLASLLQKYASPANEEALQGSRL